MCSTMGPDGRCTWCGYRIETTGGMCVQCGPTWMSIPETWTVDSLGNLLEHHPAWFGPARFAPPHANRVDTVTIS